MKKYSESEVIQKLNEAGLSATLQRIALATYLLNADHPSVEDVIKFAKKKMSKVNVSTVYNTLESLEKAGLIKKIRLSNSNQFIYDNNVEKHFHFILQEIDEIMMENKDESQSFLSK